MHVGARLRVTLHVGATLRVTLLAAFLSATLLASAASTLPAAAAAQNDYPAKDAGYHSYLEMVQTLQDTQAAHPGIVRVFSIGKSYQGRKIWVAEVSDNAGTDEGEPEVMFDGLHHAREHLSAEMPLYILRLLISQYGRDTTLGTRITHLVDTRRIWIIPMVNPDGLQYDLGGDPYRSWRKNRQPNPGSSSIGTDLNRNYDYSWSKAPSSPSSVNYRGASPFSAPETQAIRDFVLSRRVGGLQRIRSHISFHTAGEYVLWPYGHTYTDVPPDMTRLDEEALRKMGRHMAATNGYRARQSSDMYPTYGDEIDWMYGTQRIFSYTFELYPDVSDTSPSRHYPPDEIIGRETRRNREAVLYLLEQSDCPYRAIGGSAAYCGPLYDDLEVARGWTTDPDQADTATSGTWQRGDPAGSGWQLGSAISGRAVLVTGRASGVDVDGGRTTVRSRSIHLPSSKAATLRLRYWVGMSATAGSHDRFRVRLVDPATGNVLAIALTLSGNGTARHPAWTSLRFDVPGALRGVDVAVELVAADTGPDAAVEAGVDDVRITVAAP
jgi:carboxypeptidase T